VQTNEQQMSSLPRELYDSQNTYLMTYSVFSNIEAYLRYEKIEELI